MAAEDRREQGEGAAEILHAGVAMGMENAAGHDQDGGIDQKGEDQRGTAIDQRQKDRIPLGGVTAADLARLHQCRMQIEIMRHHRGADDADADIQHARIGDQVGMRQQSQRDRRDGGLRQDDLG